MTYRLSENDRLNLIPASIDYPSGLPAEVISEVTLGLPKIKGLVAGMSIDSFHAILEAEAFAARIAFVDVEGHEFGDRRKDASPLRYKIAKSAALNECVESSANLAIG